MLPKERNREQIMVGVHERTETLIDPWAGPLARPALDQ